MRLLDQSRPIPVFRERPGRYPTAHRQSSKQISRQYTVFHFMHMGISVRFEDKPVLRPHSIALDRPLAHSLYSPSHAILAPCPFTICRHSCSRSKVRTPNTSADCKPAQRLFDPTAPSLPRFLLCSCSSPSPTAATTAFIPFITPLMPLPIPLSVPMCRPDSPIPLLLLREVLPLPLALSGPIRNCSLHRRSQSRRKRRSGYGSGVATSGSAS